MCTHLNTFCLVPNPVPNDLILISSHCARPDIFHYQSYIPTQLTKLKFDCLLVRDFLLYTCIVLYLSHKNIVMNFSDSGTGT